MNKLSNWTLKMRITALATLLTSLLLVIALLAIWSNQRIRTAADSALQRAADAGRLGELITTVIKQYQAQADTAINLTLDGLAFAEATSQFEKLLAAYAETADTEEEKQWAIEMKRADQEYQKLYTEKVLPTVKNLAATADPAQKLALYAQIRVHDDLSDKLIASVEKSARAGIESLKTEAVETQAAYGKFSRDLRITIWLMSGLSVLMGVLFGYWIVQNTSRFIFRIAEQLDEGAGEAVLAARQVSSTSQLLAQGATEQAASIQETSASLEELASMTKRNAENSVTTNSLAKEARAAAENGARNTQAMSEAMVAIKKSSDDIAKIIKAIDEIAFQTNILALNAAVEAARAGEAGAGFAVVADEVRNLAQKSARAAKDTGLMIETALINTTLGVELSQKVAGNLNQIVEKTRQVDDIASEVAGACQEQTTGILQINRAISQMEKVTQGNAAGAEESAASAEELNAQAEMLKCEVGRLLNLVGEMSHHQKQPPISAALPRTKADDSLHSLGPITVNA